VPEVASQLLADRAAQGAHATPPIPQLVNAGVVQLPLAQHPYEHEFASHAHAPATQLVPAPQAALVPQRHPPAMEQLSARVGSQVVQAAPDTPHVIGDGDVHVEPEQQPMQFPGLQLLHTPPAQGPSPQF
jgi:hypothetical protein